MVKQISTERECQKEIKRILSCFLDLEQYQVFVFGSRADGQAGEMSDWDIGIWGKEPLPSGTKGMIEEALDESDIPFKIDIIDFHLVSPDFREIALSQTKKL